eukprot:CAMPEP_0196573756 /NCGR_PEP_ID=MMETSP1081-20130531/3605_1 /TAXON_ID=36882 /ORGANISM="Pyramimonas amylifera, Strain CCMP720" /LENGTH=76 /DNA_ID=CAMNT_0041891581 /DNA_START=986 /DNA_END=1216 /DNA_ORIENTATION=+
MASHTLGRWRGEAASPLVHVLLWLGTEEAGGVEDAISSAISSAERDLPGSTSLDREVTLDLVPPLVRPLAPPPPPL